MKLLELKPRWARGSRWDDDNGTQHYDTTLRHGMGITFDCPKHLDHRLAVFFENPADGLPPQHGEEFLWKRTGDNFETLSLHPSINAEIHGCWHGHITNGIIDPPR
jgi:hypothetical protein